MIKLAIIGTNWITERFLEAALATNQYQLVAVYSRSIEQAQAFALKHGATLTFNSLEALAQCEEVDTVYIASPNSLHFEQSMQMMVQGKHVICEKPIASNYVQAQQLYQCAQDKNVVLFEAFMTPYLSNFIELKQQMAQIGTISKAMINYCQYSSRYPKYLKGENPNTFNPQFSNGSIMDIGFYCVGAAIELFGEPKHIMATAQLLASGVDGHGSVIFVYDGFDVVIMHSKISNSTLASEIQGSNAALVMDMISISERLTRVERDGKRIDLTVETYHNPMFAEAVYFAKQVQLAKQGQFEELDQHAKNRSLLISKTITEIRRQTRVVFPVDL